MKIIEQGYAGFQAICGRQLPDSVDLNKGYTNVIGSCGAKLLIEDGDVFVKEESDSNWPYYYGFQCPVCNRITGFDSCHKPQIVGVTFKSRERIPSYRDWLEKRKKEDV